MTWHVLASEPPPDGIYLGFLDGDLLGTRITSIVVRTGLVFIVASVFYYDAPRVTHWMELPDAPRTD